MKTLAELVTQSPYRRVVRDILRAGTEEWLRQGRTKEYRTTGGTIFQQIRYPNPSPQPSTKPGQVHFAYTPLELYRYMDVPPFYVLCLSSRSDSLGAFEVELFDNATIEVAEAMGGAYRGREARPVLGRGRHRVVNSVADRGGDEAGIALLACDLRQGREDVLARARAAVESARFRNLALDTAAWIEAGDWAHNLDGVTATLRKRTVVAAAAEQLRRRWKKILKGGQRLDALDPQRRHRLSIQAKKLRYTTEFFATAFPHKKSIRRRKAFVRTLERMQDALPQ